MFFRKHTRMKRRENYHLNISKRKEAGSLSDSKLKTVNRLTGIPLTVAKKSGRTSLSASLTVETALVLPVFLYLMLGVLFFVQFMGTAGATEQKLHDRAKQLAVCAYYSGNITDQEFHAGYSTFLGKQDEIDLVAAYRISSQMPLFSFGRPQVIQRGFVRAWTGRDFRKELQNQESAADGQKVFVTAHGTVYHKSLQCTHLHLSIERITAVQAAARRNRYGEKYYACSCCRGGVGASVYITDTGNRYHAKLSCSGLKRTIREIPLSEAGKRRPCSKCGG